MSCKLFLFVEVLVVDFDGIFREFAHHRPIHQLKYNKKCWEPTNDKLDFNNVKKLYIMREQRSIRAGEGIKRRQENCFRLRIFGNGMV